MVKFVVDDTEKEMGNKPIDEIAQKEVRSSIRVVIQRGKQITAKERRKEMKGAVTTTWNRSRSKHTRADGDDKGGTRPKVSRKGAKPPAAPRPKNPGPQCPTTEIDRHNK
jgi:hypothetical protein